VSISVARGEKIAKTGQLELVEDYKIIILWALYIKITSGYTSASY
jgi:hypothetical protein